MEDFSWLHFGWAVGFGLLSAVSLVLGAALGLAWKPGARALSVFTAFGAGALLAALSVELVAPTALALVASGHGAGDAGPTGHGGSAGDLLAMLGGALAGGMLFVFLDQIVNAHGGFLRKTATAIAFMSKARAKRSAEILERLSAVEMLRQVPLEEVDLLVELVRPTTFHAGELVCQEGTEGDRLFFIESGEYAVKKGGAEVGRLKAGDIVGEIALLTGARRTATVECVHGGKALTLLKSHFDELRARSPELEAAASDLASSRLGQLAEHQKSRGAEEAEWASQAAQALIAEASMPTDRELKEAGEAHSGAPLAIWLGLLLDGIPESFVIGASLLATLAAKRAAGITELGFFDVLPYTLIAGLFLSNFPESMSSSVGMQKQGWSKGRVFGMWFGLMIITAAGSGVGYWLGDYASETLLLGIEGLAAGAMLTMIASTMLPEAVHLGGPTGTGLGTLSGFVAAVSFKLLE